MNENQMAPKTRTKDLAAELLRDLLIAQLGATGVPQSEIRKIVGCDMNRINRIVKPIKKARSDAKRQSK